VREAPVCLLPRLLAWRGGGGNRLRGKRFQVLPDTYEERNASAVVRPWQSR